MKSTMMKSIFGLVAVLAMAGSSFAQATIEDQPTPVVQVKGPIQTQGCYKSVPNMTNVDTAQFQTSGRCQIFCTYANAPVMATIGGTACYCGDIMPALDQQVANSNCDQKCSGYGEDMCGGIGFYTVYLDGIGGNIQVEPNSTTSSTTQAATSTKPPPTVVVTAAPVESSHSGSSSSGPNKVAIAVGVVVGVIAFAGIIGGVIVYMKHKRRKEIEEEHKAAAAQNAVRSDKASSTDARLDPAAFSGSFGSRRESIGSIADERDFSRRILQVRNPDRGSMASQA